MSRLLATIRQMGDREWTSISNECRLDISWFYTYAKEGNGLALYNPVSPVVEMDCDSSLIGGRSLMAEPSATCGNIPTHIVPGSQVSTS